MYSPTLSITHKTVHHLIKLELAIKEIKDTPLSANSKRTLMTRMNSENLYNLGKLVNAEVSFKEAEKISKGKALVSPDSSETVLVNYRSTCDFIYSATNDKYMSISPSLLLHLNKLLTNGLIDSWDSGRFRNVGDDVSSEYDGWVREEFRDIQGLDLQHHFFEVLSWYSEKKFMVHPLIKIANILYEIYHIYPFVGGNQLTFVALAELLFEKSHLSLGGLLPISRNFVLYEDEYLEAMKSGAEKNDDQSQWVEKFVRGISLDLASLKNEVVRLEEEKLKKKKKKLLDLNSRQLKVIRYLKVQPKIYRRDYVKMMGVSTMTAFRDLNELVERNIIETRGGGRSTYYILAKEDQNGKDEQKNNVVKVISDIGVNTEGGAVSDPFSNNKYSRPTYPNNPV